MKNLLPKIFIFISAALIIFIINYFIVFYNNSFDLNNKQILIELKNETEVFFLNAFNLNSMIATEQSVKNTVISREPWENYKKNYSKKYDVSGQLNDNSGLEFLVDIHKKYSFIELMFLQDMNGNQRARSLGELGTRKDRWWFKRYNNKIYSPFISKSYYSKTGDIPVVSVFHTVIDKNTPVGVLGMDVNLKWLSHKFYESDYPDEKIFFLIDNEGIIIVHPDTTVISEIYNLKKLEKEELIKDEKGNTFQEISGHHKTRNTSLKWDMRFIEITEKVLSGGKGVYNNISVDNKYYTAYFDKIKMPGEKFEGGDENYFGLLLLAPARKFYIALLLNGYFISAILLLLFICVYLFLKKSGGDTILQTFVALLNKYNFQIMQNAKPADIITEFEKILVKNKEHIALVESQIDDEKNNADKINELGKNIIDLKKENEQLKNEIIKFKPAVGSSMFAIAITDISGNIVYVNKSFEILTGYKTEEILGQNPKIFKTEYHSQFFYKEMWDTILAGKIWRGEIFNKRKNGETYWEYMTITPLHNEINNRTGFFMAVKENITDKKKRQFEIEKKQQTEIKFYKEQLEFVFRALKEFKVIIEPVLKQERKLNQKELEGLSNTINSNTFMLNEMLEYSYSNLSVERLKEENFKVSDELEKFKKIVGLKIKGLPISFSISYSAEYTEIIKGYFSGVYQTIIILTDFFLIHTDEGNIALTADMVSETENKIFIKFLLNWNIYKCNSLFASETCNINKSLEEINQYWHIFYIKKLLQIISSELFIDKMNENSYQFSFCVEFKKIDYTAPVLTDEKFVFETDDIKDRFLMLENIDYIHGLKIVNNNTEIYCRILKMFYERNGEHLNILKNYSIEQNIVKIREVIHTIKGSSANIGAENLFISAKNILDKSEGFDSNDISGFINELTKVRNSIEKFLQSEANIIESSEEKLGLKENKINCIAELNKLLDLLQNFNADSLPYFNNLVKKYDFKQFEYEIQSIQRLIFSYSFEECVVLIERLIEKIKL